MRDSLDKTPAVSEQLQVAESTIPQIGSTQPLVHNSRYDALVLDAIQRQSLVTVRSLGHRGLSVAALETSSLVPTFSSRWCQQGFCAPSYEQNVEPYLTYLEQLLDHTGPSVLITSSDGTLPLIRQYPTRLHPPLLTPLAT